MFSDADINGKDFQGNTPLHYAAAQGKLDAVKLLCDKGADPDLKNKSGQTALHHASVLNKLDVRNYLLDKVILKADEGKSRKERFDNNTKLGCFLNTICCCCLLEQDTF